MARIAIITNANKLVETKTAFFADYFGFYADKIGRLLETEPENPLSLIEKIIFQLTTSSHIKRGNYVSNYIDHHYFREDNFLKNFTSYPVLKKEIKLFKSVTGKNENELHVKRGKWLKSNTSFLPALEGFKIELEAHMIRKAFDDLMTFLLCDHSLDEHQEGIIYLTQILVSEAFFKGRKKIEIINIFTRLLSTDINRYPFPEELTTDAQKQEYLQKRDFQKQFQGIVNFLNEIPSKRYLILKVHGVSMNHTSSFTYKEVRFLGFENAEFDTIRRNFYATDEQNATLFFQAANCLLAVTPVYSFDDDFPLGQILKSVQDAVDYLGIVVDRNVHISTETYLLTSDFIEIYWKTSYPKEIGEMQLNLLEDTPFIFLEKFSGQAKTHILNQESTFIGAIKNEDIEGYWRYLENLFSHKGAQAVIDIVSTILLLNEKLDRDNHITQYLFSSTSPWNFDYQRFGMSPAEFIAIRNKLGLKKAKYFLENFDYPFFNELVTILNKRHTRKRWSRLQQHYSSLLLQLYEARNGITHANLLHNKAYFKLELTIPPILTSVRRLLFSYIRTHPTLTFQELTEIILQDAKKLLP